MRVYLHLTPNTERVPFNYQESLVGAFHYWLGPNELHDDISLYSLSWLRGGHQVKNGLDFPGGANFTVSSFDSQYLAKLIAGVQESPLIRWGMRVRELTIQLTPHFGEQRRFVVDSPVLIKRKPTDHPYHRYYYSSDGESSTLLTETLRQKLARAGLANEPVSIRFDPDYTRARIKKITYKGIDIKATSCPVIVEGSPRAVAFAWEVGVGNSTGIGFGALR